MNELEANDLPVFSPKEEKNEEESAPAVSQASKFFEIVELITFTVLIILLISSFFIQHSVVSGSSMENTLSSGDHLLISDFFYTPKTGDIIVFQPLNTKTDTPYIKRVIAVAGEKVEIKSGNVFINDVMKTDEDYLNPDLMKYDNHPPIIIPEGYVYVLGDNRHNSTDSRDPSVGLVDIRSIIGKVILRITPVDKFGAVD